MNRDVFGDEQPVGLEPAPSGTEPRAAWSPSESMETANSTASGPAASPRTTNIGFGSGMAVLAGDASPVGAPASVLVAAGSCVVASGVIAALAEGRPVLALAGWLIGGFLAVGLLAWFTVADAGRRADRWYVQQSGPGVLRLAVLVGAVLTVAANSYFFADWVSRR